MRFVAKIILFCFINSAVWAEPAVVISDTAVVFEKPDFDSAVVTELQVGEKIEVSQRAFGIFHRVKLSDGRMGFLDDSEFQFQNAKFEKKAKSNPIAKPAIGKNTEKVKKKTHPFTLSKFRGLSFQYVNYKEETMGLQPSANCLFYGFKMVGPNLLAEGDLITELNVDVFPSAPGYYEKATGHGANGWLLHTDFMSQLQFAEGKNVMTFFGFGPMLRYSSFNVAVTSGTNTNSYSLQDMVLGAVFDVGLGLRTFGNQLRFEYKYYWEKMQYSGLGVSFLMSL